MKLAIGTAQFGLDYGVKNTCGQIGFEEGSEILAQAWAAGVNTIDTAIAYGDSEENLGKLGVDSWDIISKLPQVPNDVVDIQEWVSSSISGSLDRLKVSCLKGLLLHRPSQLLEARGKELFDALNTLKGAGKVEKIGVSIYGPTELDGIWDRYQFDLVQCPFNVFDRRLVTSGWLGRLYDSGTEVHVRSVFLQGLLLCTPTGLPVGFERWTALWESWHRWLAEQEASPLQAALGHVMAMPQISRVVVGVDSAAQLSEILLCSAKPRSLIPDFLSSEDEDLLNPTRWSVRR